MRSALIVRPGALGDALLTMPLVEALDTAGVGRIAILGTPASWAFLAPASTEIFDLDGRDWLGLFDDAAPLGARAQRILGGFAAALVLLGRDRERIESVLRRRGVERVAGAAPASKDAAMLPAALVAKAELVERPWSPGPAHAASRLLSTIETDCGQGKAADWPRSPRPLADRARLRVTSDEIEQALSEAGVVPPPPQGILAIHPGSGGAAKCWPAARFAKLAESAQMRWGMAPVFLVGPADAMIWSELHELLPRALQKRVLANCPPRRVLALLSTARVYVGNDSGISHLASTACPTLALFGPTDPEVWHPLGPRVATLRAPCGRLDDLPLDAVSEALVKML